jgi:hypothetical protein
MAKGGHSTGSSPFHHHAELRVNPPSPKCSAESDMRSIKAPKITAIALSKVSSKPYLSITY